MGTAFLTKLPRPYFYEQRSNRSQVHIPSRSGAGALQRTSNRAERRASDAHNSLRCQVQNWSLVGEYITQFLPG